MSNVPFIYKATGFAMDMLESMFKANIHAEGTENLVDKPTLFVVNHFTRIETFILPHIIYKHTKKQVHSLADSALFVGKLGKYLESLGAYSVKDSFRNRRIIGELLTGQYNWVIFPEGLMVKNKKVFEKGRLQLNNPERHGPAHTGAAVLALKAAIYKKRYLDAIRNNQRDISSGFEQRYNFTCPNDISFKDIVIIPVNITYYPIRPGKNLLTSLAHAMVKELPDRIEEELQIEGQILFSNSDITVYFNTPITVQDYINPLYKVSRYFMGYLSYDKQNNFMVGLQKRRLTNRFMNDIYTKVAINLDHLFCSAIKHYRKTKIKRDDFCRALFLTASSIWHLAGRRTHPSLQEDLIKIIADEDFPAFEDIKSLAVEEELLIEKEDDFILDASTFQGFSSFHSVRLHNLVEVISNEIEPLKYVNKILKTNINQNPTKLKERLVHLLIESDQRRYESDYHQYHDPQFSKDIDLARPYHLSSPKNSTGVLISHGYLASPAEVRGLAEFIHQAGFNVYAICLKGHGTAPIQLNHISWKDWVTNMDRGYAILKNTCRQVVCGGFSAGGILSLLTAANKGDKLKGVFCINAALKLADIKSHFVPTVVLWNELLDNLKIGKGKMEFVENKSENPEVNYSRNYLKGVYQLEELSKQCQKSLTEINIPTYLIQSDQDPVVNPKSAELIHEAVATEDKQVVTMPFDRHNILHKDGCEKVFEKVLNFIKRVSLET